MITTERLIERWLPIAALGEESVRERRSMTALPPTYYLHVWWARRPLVASRAAILASLLPADADHQKFLHMLGIHGDPVRAQQLMTKAKRRGERVSDPYGYKRAFTHAPSSSDLEWLTGELNRTGRDGATVLDPTAGGGSIPFEAVRLGLSTIANDLNPVAALILHGTVAHPARHGQSIRPAFDALAKKWRSRMQGRLASFFPDPPSADSVDTTFILARTIRCPHCDGLIPLSPNWRLAPGGVGVRLRPDCATRRCSFEIVESAADQSDATVSRGSARCPFPDCGRVVEGDEVKSQGRAGGMGEQLFAVVFKKSVLKTTKTGRTRQAWERGYRAPRPEDDVSELVAARLAEKLPEWEALDIVPSEPYLEMFADRSRAYGVRYWRDLFNSRQLLGHGYAVEVFRELLDEYRDADRLGEIEKVAFCYLALSLDKLRDYNSRMTRWHSNRQVVVNTFDRHDFAFKWSYAEMAQLISGLGFDWALKQTAKCIQELVELVCPGRGTAAVYPLGTASQHGLFGDALMRQPLLEHEVAGAPRITVTCKSGDTLDHVADGSIDAVVMDPPYGANVMYAELSDFFYVWLKRTAGHVYPELFRRQLTDKENEAVANPARFKGQGRVAERAEREYQARMAAIFVECRRVLKADGILTVMFTHKGSGAWDALTSGLMEAGFVITASWPVNTEAEGSLHIKDKAAANSTIFLVCRPRVIQDVDKGTYWEDVEPLVAEAVRRRIAAYEAAGIRGVDLYLSCFGPALEEFSKHWPLKRGQPRQERAGQRKRRAAAEIDPYAVTVEDALDAARREVKRHRMDKLLRVHRKVELDPLTEWFVLAWDAFKAPKFPYDEGLRLARVVGLDLDGEVVGKVAAKDGSNLVVWDSATRAASGGLGPPDGSRALLDCLHHAAHRARTDGLQAARELLAKSDADKLAGFPAALAAVLEVLPVSSTFTHVEDEEGPVAASASDFEVLENLRRLAYSDRVQEPEQLGLWTENAT